MGKRTTWLLVCVIAKISMKGVIDGLRVNQCSQRLVKKSWIQFLIAYEFLGLEEPKKLTLVSFLHLSFFLSFFMWLLGISCWGWWF
jgi:hypothetical protein